jgi:hypothetical protein
MKTAELLRETTETEFQMGMMYKFLQANLPAGWVADPATYASYATWHKILVHYSQGDTGFAKWAFHEARVWYDDKRDIFTIDGYTRKSRMFTKVAKFEDVLGIIVDRIKADEKSTVTEAAKPVSLIYRAIKHITEVEHRMVYSLIPGAEGSWSTTSRTGDTHGWLFPICCLSQWGDDDDGNEQEDWFDLLPEDDNRLAIRPHGDDYEVYDISDGEFTV